MIFLQPAFIKTKTNPKNDRISEKMSENEHKNTGFRTF